LGQRSKSKVSIVNSRGNLKIGGGKRSTEGRVENGRGGENARAVMIGKGWIATKRL